MNDFFFKDASKKLVCAIIEQALLDLKRTTPRKIFLSHSLSESSRKTIAKNNQTELIRFFLNGDCDFLIDAVGLKVSKSALRQKILQILKDKKIKNDGVGDV